MVLLEHLLLSTNRHNVPEFLHLIKSVLNESKLTSPDQAAETTTKGHTTTRNKHKPANKRMGQILVDISLAAVAQSSHSHSLPNHVKDTNNNVYCHPWIIA